MIKVFVFHLSIFWHHLKARLLNLPQSWARAWKDGRIIAEAYRSDLIPQAAVIALARGDIRSYMEETNKADKKDYSKINGEGIPVLRGMFPRADLDMYVSSAEAPFVLNRHPGHEAEEKRLKGLN